MFDVVERDLARWEAEENRYFAEEEARISEKTNQVALLTSDGEEFENFFFGGGHFNHTPNGVVGNALLDVLNNGDCTALRAILQQMIDAV